MAERVERHLTTILAADIAEYSRLMRADEDATADNALAEKFFQQAIDLDPNFSGGYEGLATAQTSAAFDFQVGNPTTILSSIEALARRAVVLGNDSAEAYSTLSSVLRLRGDLSGALAEAERALQISPNLVRAHIMLGMAQICAGRPNEGLAFLERSFTLDPRAQSYGRANWMVVGL